MAPGNKGIMEGKDNPALVFSGATKDWPAFKDAIQLGADKLDTTWVLCVDMTRDAMIDTGGERNRV